MVSGKGVYDWTLTLIFTTAGMGQAHSFFQKGVKGARLAVDPPLAKQAIRDGIAKIP